MRFLIEITASGAEDSKRWTVQVVPPDGVALALPERALSSGVEGGKRFPLPPGSQDTLLGEVASIYRDFELRDEHAGHVTAFGDYLFDCLFGADTWSLIVDAAGDEIELALSWSETEWELWRLPWEMLRSAAGFLATSGAPRVAVTRLVEAAGAAPDAAGAPLEITPRLLFVVGTSLDDPRARPGAEYLGLLRGLESWGLALEQRVLLAATEDSLRRAIEEFRPSIVHLSCHGGVTEGRGYIELLPVDEGAHENRRYTAESLAALLGLASERPAVLVLSACQSGAAGHSELAPTRSLAAECVRAGIPVVVGMGGEVSDRTCRLFTVRFYEALLRESCIVRATADARRAPFIGGGDPAASWDWALPCLFLARHVASSVKVQGDDRIRLRNQAADKYPRIKKPRAFCDRLETLELAMRMTDGAAGAPTVMAVRVEKPDHEDKYGKTRLLHELTQLSVRSGHVACLILLDSNSRDIPKDALAFGVEIWRELKRTFERFGLEKPADMELYKLASHAQGSPEPDFHADVAEALVETRVQGASVDESLRSARVVREALRLDLERLRAAVAEHTNFPATRVLILVDNVHLLGGLVAGWLQTFLSPQGLGRPNAPLPVVFTYSAGNDNQDYARPLQLLRAYVESEHHVAVVSLGAFQTRLERELAYSQFLLGYDPPLVVRKNRRELVFENLDMETSGIPSKLTCTAAEATIRVSIRFDALEEADDRGILGALDGGGGGGG